MTEEQIKAKYEELKITHNRVYHKYAIAKEEYNNAFVKFDNIRNRYIQVYNKNLKRDFTISYD